MILLIFRRLFYLIAVLLLSTAQSSASITTSSGTGNWNNSGTWSNGVPSCGDTIIISPGHTVTVSAHIELDETSAPACSTAMYVEINGTLHFNTGKKLYLACGSAVYITSTGNLSKGSGGGNSNLIDECGSTIWNADDGNLTGPQWVGSPLPITLKFFKAVLESEIIHFNWVTLSEINNDLFVIQRSLDLKNMVEITSVPGAGNSRDELFYEAFDLNPLPGIQYYRLKQTDYDGTTSYSKWVAVDSDISEIQDVSVHPNLVQSNFHISFINLNEQIAEIYLHDLNGSLISKKEIKITDQSFIWTSTNDMLIASGPAFITIYVNEQVYKFKLIYKG